MHPRELVVLVAMASRSTTRRAMVLYSSLNGAISLYLYRALLVEVGRNVMGNE